MCPVRPDGCHASHMPPIDVRSRKLSANLPLIGLFGWAATIRMGMIWRDFVDVSEGKCIQFITYNCNIIVVLYAGARLLARLMGDGSGYPLGTQEGWIER